MENFSRRQLLVAPTTLPAETANTTAEAELSQVNFDTNMVIILAALLCALVCALGLNSVIRCVLQCSRRAENAEEINRVSRRGLNKKVLRKIPIFIYGKKCKGSETQNETEDGNFDDECCICLGEFGNGDKIRVLPNCNHGFHVKCIDTWLKGNSSCPICRFSVSEAVSGKSSKGVGFQRGGGSGNGDHVVVEMNRIGS